MKKDYTVTITWSDGVASQAQWSDELAGKVEPELKEQADKYGIACVENHTAGNGANIILMKN